MIKKITLLEVPAIFRLLLVAIAVLSLAACGGSSGGGHSADSGSSTTTVSGVVTDPAISGSAVRLVDAEGNALTRIVVTGDDGRFKFELPASNGLEGMRVVAVGGQDVATGQDLSGITLSAAYSEGVTVVSPLSTLALAYQDDGGSLERFASMMGLPEDGVLADPSASADTQKVSMLVTELMVTLKGTGTGHSGLLEHVEMAGGDLAAAADSLAAAEGMPASTVARLQKVSRRIAAIESLAEAPADAAGMVAELNWLNIRDGVASYLDASLGFAAQTEAQEANIDNLSSAIFDALDGRGLAAESEALLNIARYVVVVNGLDAAALAADTFEVPKPIDRENLLPLLAETETLESTLPLASGEELGSDNAARVDYFFRTELSPYYRAAKLFDGVIDDQVLDPVYADVAVGQAAAGLVEEAKLTAGSSIFQKVVKFNAYRKVGEQLQARGDVEGATDLWQQALADFNSYIDAKGVLNLSAEDGTYLSSLSGNFRAVGRADLADEAFASVQTYLDSEADPNGELASAYRSLMWAIDDRAGELVDATVLAGGSRADAINAVQLLEQVVFGAGQYYRDGAPHDGYCYNFRTLSLESVAIYYQRLGRTDDVIRMLDEYERLLQVDCNWKWGRNMADDFAPVYGELGLLDRFENLLVNVVEPMEDGLEYADDARSEVSLYIARDLALEGTVQAAIDAVTESQESLIEQVSTLTFVGKGASFDDGKTGLSTLLAEAGYAERAKDIADYVFGFVLSDEFSAEALESAANLNENATHPSQFIGEGCRKVAALYDWLGYPTEAESAMSSCESRAKELFVNQNSATAQVAETHELLAAGYQWIGNTSKSRELIATAAALVDVYTDASKRAYEKQVLALLYAGNGDLQQALDTMVSARGDLVAISSLSGTQEELEDAIKRSGTLSATYLEIAGMARGRLAGEGVASGSDPAQVVAARQALRTMWLDEDSASGWPGTITYVDALNDPDLKQEYRNSAIRDLAQARFFGEAEVQARSYELAADRNEALSILAGILTSYDDYPGSETVRFDFDNDGLPDFYSPLSTQQERDALAVSLDDDIDGDGNAAVDDPTPYCSSCET